MMNLSKISNLDFDNIDYNDYPDFCDAFVVSADYGFREMTSKELDELNTDYGDFVHEELLNYLY
jgi:hypothetical protein